MRIYNYVRNRKKKITFSCACFIVIVLTIGLSVGLTRNNSSSSSSSSGGGGGGSTLLVGTTEASVGLNKLGILNINQGRITGGCTADFNNIDATTFENQVIYSTSI
jgi:hypothetical protein